jgi:hypothetical protein
MQNHEVMKITRHKFVHASRGACRYCCLGEEALVHQSQPQSNDPVNHPAHYCADATHEVAVCLAAWGLESDALLWNTVKYIARHGKKGNALEDLRKAKWYLDRRIKQMEEEANGST